MQTLRKRFVALIRKHLRTIIDFSIILAVTIVVFRNWIFSPQWPAGGDILGYISREYLYWKDSKWLFVWRPNSFGYPEGINLMDFLFMLLRFIAENAVNTAKIFAISSFALAGLTMYTFGYHYTKKKLPALAGSLIYILNGQFLTQLTEAHLDIMFSYAVAPLIFLFLDRALDTGKVKDIVASSILFGIMLTGFHPEMILIYGIFLALFLMINLFRPQKSWRLRDCLKFRLKTLISICALAALVSACFWLPLLFNVRAPYLSTTFSRGNLEDAYAYSYQSFEQAFTLTGKEYWGYVNVLDVTTQASLQILPVPTILLLVFAFAYVITLVFKLNRYSLFFGLSALFSIILSMGPYALESHFVWAWSNIPNFQAFRAVSRWNMMTAFANSFFVCASASILTGYLAKVSRKSKEDSVAMDQTPPNSRNNAQKPRNPKVSPCGFKRISHYARSSLSACTHYAAIFALVIILMSGFISTWFLFSNGLQVYTPPSDYIQPYEYVANIPGQYKIVAVGRSSGDWAYAGSSDGQDMDFVGNMLTSIGWSHDIGYESTFIHDKPVLQDGGLSAPSTDFVSYLRFDLARNNITRNLLKLLGAFGYKYVVIPPYVTENDRVFIMSQYGGQVIYDQDNSIILENKFYTPSVFGPTQSALVFGGAESLSSLFDIDSFDLSKVAVISAYQSDFQAMVDNHLNDIAAIVFADADTSDLMLMPSNGVHLIYLASYGIQSWNASRFWIRSDAWTNVGVPVLGGRVLTTSGKNEVNIPVELNVEGDYDIFIRAGFDPNRGKLSVMMDDFPLADIVPYSSYWSGLRWVNLTSNLHLEPGSHTITLLNDGTGYNDLDAIAIVEHSKLVSQTEETINALQSFTGKILYIIEAEKAFSYTLPEEWSISTVPGEGYALHMEGAANATPQASTSIFVPRKGEYNFAARLFSDNESNGTLYLKLDNRLFSVNSSANGSKADWFELGSASLDAGEHNINIFASGNVTLDKIGAYSASDGELAIDDVFRYNVTAPSVSYEETNPCRYVAHVNCTKPFLLVLSESYHPLWKAYMENAEISPVIVNSLANGFFINSTGTFDVFLYFTGQDVADIGLIVSGGSTIFLIAVVLVRSARVKSAKRFLFNRKLIKGS